MAPTTGMKDTVGYGCRATVIVAAGYGAIMSAGDPEIIGTSGIVIASIASGSAIGSNRSSVPRSKRGRGLI